MSTISNRHSIVPFISGETKAFHGQRLAKVGYKSSKKQVAKFKSVAASIPLIHKDDVIPMIPLLMNHIIEMIQNGQDGILKSLYESSGGKLDSVSDTDMSIAAVIGYLEAENTGGRLTKELINNWFDVIVKDNVTVLIADKLGFISDDDTDSLTKEQDNVVSMHVNGYREVMSSLAGGKTFLAMKQINGLKVVLNTIDSDDEIGAKLGKRLDMMISEHEKVNELAALL